VIPRVRIGDFVMDFKKQLAQIKQESLVKWMTNLLGDPFEIKDLKNTSKIYYFQPKNKKSTFRNAFQVIIPNEGIDDYEMSVGEAIIEVCQEIDRKDYTIWLQKSINEIIEIQETKQENRSNVKLYQLYVKGSQKYCESAFTCFSKKVYKHEPTEQEKQEFVDLCCDEKNVLLNVLDKNKEYKVKCYELDVIE
jgi:hypothetical protein